MLLVLVLLLLIEGCLLLVLGSEAGVYALGLGGFDRVIVVLLLEDRAEMVFLSLSIL